MSYDHPCKSVSQSKVDMVGNHTLGQIADILKSRICHDTKNVGWDGCRYCNHEACEKERQLDEKRSKKPYYYSASKINKENKVKLRFYRGSSVANTLDLSVDIKTTLDRLIKSDDVVSFVARAKITNRTSWHDRMNFYIPDVITKFKDLSKTTTVEEMLNQMNILETTTEFLRAKEEEIARTQALFFNDCVNSIKHLLGKSGDEDVITENSSGI